MRKNKQLFGFLFGMIFSVSIFSIVIKYFIHKNHENNIPSRDLAVIESRIKIAVIDTGIDFDNKEIRPFICTVGNKDFTNEGLRDFVGHGSNVAGIISRNLNPKKYCLLIIKWYTTDTLGNLRREVESFKYAVSQDVKFINFSGGGVDDSKQESKIITEATEKGIKVSVAAGNEHCDLGKKCNFFPACYPITKNFYVIGNCNSVNTNYNGPVKYCEDGMNVCAGNYCMSGTSQATAIFTNKLVLKDNL